MAGRGVLCRAVLEALDDLDVRERTVAPELPAVPSYDRRYRDIHRRLHGAVAGLHQTIERIEGETHNRAWPSSDDPAAQSPPPSGPVGQSGGFAGRSRYITSHLKGWSVTSRGGAKGARDRLLSRLRPRRRRAPNEQAHGAAGPTGPRRDQRTKIAAPASTVFDWPVM